MAFYKNKSGQSIAIYAHDTSADAPKTGDAANITARIFKDNGAGVQTNDVNPTELDPIYAKGVYVFNMTQEETNADLIVLPPQSATPNVSIEPVFIYTEPETRDANVAQISGDEIAADNLEATYDGTGYTDPFGPAHQQQVDNLAIGSAGIVTTAESATVSTGSETNTYTDTQQADGTYHQITDDGGTIDLYYQFDVGTTGIPNQVDILGRVSGLNDSIDVYGYNWGTSTWEQVGTIDGKAGSSDSPYGFKLLVTHVGTGANDGKVRVRFYSTGLSSANLYIDFLTVSYAVVRSAVGYANGAIWIDTNNGTSGSVDGVNGVADYPVDNWADALALSSNTGLTTFYIMNGSSITLSGDSSNYTLIGYNWTLELNNQVITDMQVKGAFITGTGTGSGYTFKNCTLADGATLTVADGDCFDCALAGSIVLSAAGTYYFDKCFSGAAGISTPDIDFGAAVGDTNLNFRHYSGGIEVKNMGASGTDKMSLEGNGQLVLNANCSGGTIAIRGNFTVTDNAGGAVTLSDDARVDQNQITAACEAGSLVSDVWDHLLASISTAGSIGKLIKDYLDAAISSRSTVTKAEVNAEVDTALADYDPPTKAEMDAGLSGIETKVDTVDTVVDAIKAKTDNLPNDPASTTNVSAVETKVDTVDTVVDAIKAKTDNLPADPADDSDIDAQLASISSAISALKDPTVDEIWAKVIEAEGSITAQQAMSIVLAVLAGVTSGQGLTFKTPNGNTVRVTAVTDANRNRTSMTLSPSS